MSEDCDDDIVTYQFVRHTDKAGFINQISGRLEYKPWKSSIIGKLGRSSRRGVVVLWTPATKALEVVDACSGRTRHFKAQTYVISSVELLAAVLWFCVSLQPRSLTLCKTELRYFEHEAAQDDEVGLGCYLCCAVNALSAHLVALTVCNAIKNCYCVRHNTGMALVSMPQWSRFPMLRRVQWLDVPPHWVRGIHKAPALTHMNVSASSSSTTLAITLGPNLRFLRVSAPKCAGKTLKPNCLIRYGRSPVGHAALRRLDLECYYFNVDDFPVCPNLKHVRIRITSSLTFATMPWCARVCRGVRRLDAPLHAQPATRMAGCLHRLRCLCIPDCELILSDDKLHNLKPLMRQVRDVRAPHHALAPSLLRAFQRLERLDAKSIWGWAHHLPHILRRYGRHLRVLHVSTLYVDYKDVLVHWARVRSVHLSIGSATATSPLPGQWAGLYMRARRT